MEEDATNLITGEASKVLPHKNVSVVRGGFARAKFNDAADPNIPA
jgi:hypothetical protein